MFPINIATVANREISNDGSHIYLHFHKECSVWIAYGKSAFALRLMIKNSQWDSLRTYSDRLQLPCTIIDSRVLAQLKKNCAFDKIDTNTLHFLYTDKFDENDYTRWIYKVNQAKDLGSERVKNPVSDQVPQNTYIVDGMSSFARNIKRVFDCIAAFILMLIFSPLFIICYVLIKREDGGNPIFKQERIGRFGRPFHIYKFRSMRMDAEKMGPQLSHAGGNDDPRLTKIGKFIRAHHLDELPQLYNVFIGDMSFVGPRPERKFYIDQIMEYDKRYVYLYQIRPGVTSPATLYNGYTDTMAKMLSRLEWDLYYLGNRSWWFDIKILLKTFFSIVFGKKF